MNKIELQNMYTLYIYSFLYISLITKSRLVSDKLNGTSIPYLGFRSRSSTESDIIIIIYIYIYIYNIYIYIYIYLYIFNDYIFYNISKDCFKERYNT